MTQVNLDFVDIYDGPDTSSPLLARISGNYRPGSAPGGFITTQRSMYVRFASNGFKVAPGFIATYSTVPSA